MLKKQTVWLLTMLSLMIVLSVYYMTSPDMEDQAFIDEGLKQNDDVVTTGEGTEGEANVEDIANVGQEDELFTSLRLEIQDSRSERKDRLADVVASSSATTEQKNEALNEMDVLDQLATKESVLEESILANTEYQDVLVRSNQDQVQINVKSGELTNQEVVQIMQMARDEFGEIPVNVYHQPKSE
ncbi:stage III sporulation protein AH [Virgibacillus phasianinus]|uniref:Stage III sporulation protein AH n=1 Tax=Virgibacillus phasianinus TaxID=2017483 RepID=A0A220U5I2_9BACI|nr:SpoIIIAH-like family protein [Virgibacillus phasianinus]ASK63232.1 stage III sporulation protein AH [Virgibacillus phasianinus]